MAAEPNDDPTPPAALRNHGGSPPARVLRHFMWRRMNIKNEHFMGVIVGREGSGKSHTALSICRSVDPTFDADRVFFDPADLVKAFKNKELGAGTMVMLDEAGVGLGNRSWYEKEQILLNQTLQTVRDENMGVLYTLPRLSELDKQTIGRLHALLSMREKHPDEGWAEVSWKNIEVTREKQTDKTYKKYPRMRVNGRKQRITSISITKPPEPLAEAYEERKSAFKAELYDEVIDAHDEADGSDGYTPQEVADEILQNGRVEEFVSQHPQNKIEYLDADLLGAEYNLSIRKAKTAKKLVEKEAQVG